ncbi:DUF1206 domain-containing protein [Nocardioides litoris]|uniref:DUF1206 domain-containing protein n=1 Tax=Nocardioides litoris TaxID=1926648 RepID=UPI0011232ED1|nr:DUF1206 domain-containing protein [Nocardioides litoris]
MSAAATSDDVVDKIAQVGLVAFGVVHLVLGWLVVTLALGDREGSASTTGAMRQLDEQPLGGALVWAVSLGMFLLVVWQAVEAWTDDETKDRLVHAGRAVVYAVIGVSGVRVATGSGGGGGTDSMTARLMDAPGGQLFVGAVGLGVVAVGGALLWQAWTESYLDHLDGRGRSGDAGRAYRVLARVGHVAKGLALGAVGVLFGYAAATHDAKKSGGVDQALRQVLDQSGGPVVVGLLGLGFAAFGVYCFAWSRHLSR